LPVIAEREREIASTMAWCLDQFRKLAYEIETPAVIIFFLIAGQPGVRMKELEKLTGLSSSAVSRNVLLLGERGWKRQPDGTFPPGLDLVVTATDPFDVRAKVASLTPRGRRLFERVCQMWT
jgi:DNA-binding MarR family transcriptional regulator